MPDWIAHLCVAYLLILLLGIKKYRSLVFVGAVLPDLMKVHLLFRSSAGYYPAANFFAPFHTAAGVLLTGALIASFLEGIEWKKGYALILLGAASHLVLDSLLYPYGRDMWYTWPLWLGCTNWGFIWSDSFYPAIIGLAVAIPLWIWERNKSRG